MNDSPEIIEPVDPVQNPDTGLPVKDISTYTDNAETAIDPLYNISFIKETVCDPSMEFNTIAEFTACQSWYMLESVIAFGNLITGIILGFLVVKGMFEVWR